MVWIFLAAMTVAAVLCVVWPLSKPRRPTPARADGDLRFYREQMQAIEGDLASGLVSPAEAAGSRAEIGRRLIAASDDDATPDAMPARRRLFAIAAAVMVFVPLVSISLYLRVGSPDLNDEPLVARLGEPGKNDIGAAIARVETHLAQQPDDGRGFEILAPIYLRLGRFGDAAQAYERSLALLGETAARRTGYGQALMMQADGVVTAEARAAFVQASADDPDAAEPKFFLGLAAEQDGDKALARTIWSALVSTSPADAPFLPLVRDRLAALDKPGAAPPKGAAAAAIASLPPEQRQAAIRGMVEGLAARLKTNGQDKEGWLRLVRAYTVLGERAKAVDALADARKTLAGDAQGLSQLNGLAQELGLGS